VLVGGLNKGGQGIYALDVTNPANFSEANASSIYSWEFTDANDADLGYTYSRPAIVKVRTSSGTRWAAVFGNGYNNTFDDTSVGGQKSSTGNAVLYVVDIESGAIIKKIDTATGTAQDPLGAGSARPNGLATPAVVDINGDSVADYAFAGDLFGNMWKFDLTNNDPSTWGIAFAGAPLFIAKDSGGKTQPITSRPEVGRGPNGKGMVVLFGTGKFLEPNDKDVSKLSTQTFYGLYDGNTGSTTAISGRGQLTPQSILLEDKVTFGSISVPVRATTQTPVAIGNRGWYLDLLSGSPGVPPPSGFKGEMQVSDSILRNGRIIFSTIIPNTDPCEYGGTSWLMELDALSGGRLVYPPLDLNDDGKFDNNDYVTLADGVTKVPVSGIQSSEGMIGKAGVLSGQNAEYKYTSGTSGNMQTIRENPGPGDIGRQSWRQLR
jgi:type IV pilus assembly protein PilY1